jgi:hypothetical protein
MFIQPVHGYLSLPGGMHACMPPAAEWDATCGRGAVDSHAPFG